MSCPGYLIYTIMFYDQTEGKIIQPELDDLFD